MPLISYATQIAIVGGGPTGLAAACVLSRAGWRVTILERGAFAANVAKFPTYMRFFSTSDLVELCSYPLALPDEKPTRRQYLRYLQRFAKYFDLDIRTRHEVIDLEGQDGRFLLTGRTELGETFEMTAEKVVLATGAYDHPNRLEVPGEDLPKVSHYYSEVNDYFGRRTLIVGGRHSAAEAALELCRAGVEVTMCHRGPAFRDLKYWVGPDLENRIREGRIKAFFHTRVREIRPASVVLQTEGEALFEVDNDAVLALIGYQPDPTFLTRMGVAVDAQTRCPAFNQQTLESARPGVYVAGVMLAGNVSGAIFIENSRTHGERILANLKRSRGAARAGW